MKTVFLSFFSFVFLILYGCASGCPPFSAENAVRAQLNGHPAEGLLILSEAGNGSAWFRTRNNRCVEPIETVQQALGARIWQAEISRADTYLAVLSAEEGHPRIEIFLLEDLLGQTGGTGNSTVSPLSALNPYPGTVWIEGWQGDILLEISSDTPLDALTGREDPMDSENWDYEPDIFLWNVETGTITRK